MSQNNKLAERLTNGETVQWKPIGNSMNPLIKSGDLVTVAPCKIEDLKAGDITFCKVKGNYYLHLVRQVGDDGRVMIANNHGHVNGWTRTVFGKFVK
jgi:hypothetical protein